MYSPGFPFLDMSYAHCQIVWPYGTPPVTTFQWTPDDWLKYALTFRPSDYTGGEFDKDAWAAYRAKKELENIRKAWPNFTVEPTLDGKFHMVRK